MNILFIIPILLFLIKEGQQKDIAFVADFLCEKEESCGQAYYAVSSFYLGMKDGGAYKNGTIKMRQNDIIVKFYDSRMNTTTQKSTLFETAVEVYLNTTTTDPPVALIGMTDGCREVAQLAIGIQKPLITYDCRDNIGEAETANAYTVQLDRNEYAKFRALGAFLNLMNWTTVSIIDSSEAEGNPSQSNLESSLIDSNIKITASATVIKSNTGKNSESELYYIALLDVYLKSRIIIFQSSSLGNLQFFLFALNRLGILETSQYYVILLIEQMVDTSYNQAGLFFKYIDELKGEIRMFPENFMAVCRSVGIFTDVGVLNFTDPFVSGLTDRLTTIITNNPSDAPCPPLCGFNAKASYSVIFNDTSDMGRSLVNSYNTGKLLAETLLANPDMNLTDPEEIVRIMRNATFTGLADYPLTFDVAGAMRRSYSLFRPYKIIPDAIYKYPLHDLAKVIARIRPDTNGTWKIKLEDTDVWDFLGGTLPKAEPDCGFDNEKCPQTPVLFTEAEIAIICVSVAAALVMLGIISYIIRWIMYERKLESCYWLIERSHLTLCDITQMGNKAGSAILQSMMSMQSVNGGLQDMDDDAPVKGTLQFYEHNLKQAARRRREAAKKEKKVANSPADDEKWSDIYEWKMAKFEGQLVTVRRIYKESLKLNRDMKLELDHLMNLNNENLNKFYGLINEREHIFTVHAYGVRKSLNDLLRNTDLRLDRMFKVSFVDDVCKGLRYLHEKCKIGHHGNLKSTNSLVDAYWRVKLSNFGMDRLRDGEEKAKPDDLLWTAPEVLRRMNDRTCMKGDELVRADVYSLGIVLYEIYGRQGPFGDDLIDSSEVVEQLKFPGETPIRPDLRMVNKAPDTIQEAIKICWSESPYDRPPVKKVRDRLRMLNNGLRSNIADNIMALLDRYRFNLEDVIKERTEALEEEKRRNESLLLQLLPRSVAECLKNGKPVDAEYFECITIYFSDIVGFTSLSSKSSPLQIVDMLNDLYTTFDNIIDQFDCYKVETIGDAYMFVSGLPEVNSFHHSGEVAGAACELLEHIATFEVRHFPDEKLKLRIGIHSGPVVTGVVGVRMPRYCLFGDTVITASKMESSGEAMKIQISVETHTLLKLCGGYLMSPRGEVEIKANAPPMLSYWLHSYEPRLRYQRLTAAINSFPQLKRFVAA